jgi:hypothetical protein
MAPGIAITKRPIRAMVAPPIAGTIPTNRRPKTKRTSSSASPPTMVASPPWTAPLLIPDTMYPATKPPTRPGTASPQADVSAGGYTQETRIPRTIATTNPVSTALQLMSIIGHSPLCSDHREMLRVISMIVR